MFFFIKLPFVLVSSTVLLTRAFCYLGFELVKPDHLIASIAGDLRLMVYDIQQTHSSEE